MSSNRRQRVRVILPAALALDPGSGARRVQPSRHERRRCLLADRASVAVAAGLPLRPNSRRPPEGRRRGARCCLRDSRRFHKYEVRWRSRADRCGPCGCHPRVPRRQRHRQGHRGAGDLPASRRRAPGSRLSLGALHDTEDAPGYVVVDWRRLGRPPDKGYDRERAVRLGVQQVAAVLFRVTITLLSRQDLWSWHVQLHLVSHQGRRRGPVGPALSHRPHRADQVAQTSVSPGHDSRLPSIHIKII